MSVKPRSAVLAVLTAGAMALGLAACAPQAEVAPDAGATPPGTTPGTTCTPAGPASDSIEITGDFGTELALVVPDSLSVSGIERTVLIEGAEGEGATEGQTVRAYYTVFDGETGEVFERGSDISTEPVPFLNDGSIYSAGIVAALNCATEQSRIVTVMTAGEAFGDNAISLGLAADNPIVLVLDVDAVEDTVLPETPPAATVERDAALEAPAVDLQGAAPTVTLPTAAPPTAFQLEVLVPGDGQPVPAGATVTVDYHGVSWDTGTVFDSSYSRGGPATFSTDGVIEGFRDALVGQPVGTTLLATIPPDLAYGPDAAAHPLGGQTLVFVVHIVSVD